MKRYPQLAKEALLTSRLRANISNRIWAKCLDTILIICVHASVLFFFGFTAGVAALLLSFLYIDRVGDGQSPGKWLFGLHVIDVRSAASPRAYACFVRNLPFFILILLYHLHGFMVQILMFFCILWLALELYFISQLRSGVRIGDLCSKTRVFDYKDQHTQFVERFLKDDSYHRQL